MLKRCQTNIYLHKTLLKLLSILISMIGSINTPSLIRKVYNTAARIISPLSLLKYSTVCLVNFFLKRNSPVRSPVVSLLKFLDHTQLDTHTHTQNYTHTHIHPVVLLWRSDEHVAVAATYTTHNKHKRRTPMPSAGLESAIPAIERPQIYALDRMATGIGVWLISNR